MNVAWLRELLAARAFAPDALVQVDDGNLPLRDGLETLPYPSVFYSIDTFCNPWHIPFAHAFDHIWVAQKDFRPLFTAEGHRAEWIPLFCPPVGSPETPEEWLAARDIPVAFAGTLRPKNIPERLPFLRAFRARRPLLITESDFTQVYARTRIVLNQTAAFELNCRCFEAMGCGAALLHDSDSHGFHDLFREARNVLPPYARLQAQSAVAVAEAWLSRPQALAELALAGAELVARKHNDDVRAAELTRLCDYLARRHVHEARLADLPRRRLYLSSAYGALAAELPLRLRPHRDFYALLARRGLGLADDESASA
jgi:hypothetical protein